MFTVQVDHEHLFESMAGCLRGLLKSVTGIPADQKGCTCSGRACWDEFEKAMEKEFRLASRRFWETIRRAYPGCSQRGGGLQGGGKSTLRNF